MNSEGFRETFLRNDREGPKKAKMAGRDEATTGTEGPRGQRSGIGRVKAESSLETTGNLAPVYRGEGIQDWEVVMSTIPKRKYKRSDIEANCRNETKTF